MKKTILKIIIIILQVCTFYLAPLLFKVFNPVHVIVGMLISTFGLSMMIAVVSKRKVKYLFCLLAVALFIGSIPIYYNTSAYETVIWYFAVSVGGLLLGFLIDKFVDSVYNKK